MDKKSLEALHNLQARGAKFTFKNFCEPPFIPDTVGECVAGRDSARWAVWTTEVASTIKYALGNESIAFDLAKQGETLKTKGKPKAEFEKKLLFFMRSLEEAIAQE